MTGLSCCLLLLAALNASPLLSGDSGLGDSEIAPMRMGLADEAWAAYLAGNFNRVDSLAGAAMGDGSLSQAALAKVLLALGCSDAMRGRRASAQTAFERALSLSPSLRLTAYDLPPPVWKLFEPVQERVRTSRTDSLLAAPPGEVREAARRDTVVVRVQSGRSAGAQWRSLAWPGWGQLSEGEPRGWWFTAAAAATAVGALWSAILTDQAHDEYLRARTPEQIASTYDRYNRRYKLTWGLGGAAAGVYLAAQWDFFRETPQLSAARSPAGGLAVKLTFSPRP